jgi:xanthine dehydrogenase accessory factor
VETSIANRIQDLTRGRVPFVRATVVRAEAPTSAHACDEAIVLADGSIEGFVGGQCAESSVRTAALGTLRGGGSLLLRIMPEEQLGFPETPGAKVVVNPCLSGGALEIFLEPLVPPPLVEIVGTTPIAHAVTAICELVGYATARSLPGAAPSGASAVVVASHGKDEEDALRAALAADVPYIALVASRKRGTSVLAGLDLDDEQRARVRTPAGLDIGATSAEEVALSIVAEFVRELRTGAARPAVEPPVLAALLEAVDPVCGMTVTVVPGTPHLVVDGQDFWFCNPGCRTRYAELTAH